ncbi:uncharacterized protein [Physcomitrium patens]|uniref:Fanconi anemia group D2 protein n=1 Tax=Physcomitrium patens TaxID=3218 RepID=A0A2K1KVD6_PHYPA|nr:Fanconi anemia group D2 protein-like isoform X1 [Physcomitrium patens]XP_024372059.1 Fanconi anemia group D2 protein-like isoform X1 [Physcomitrium patens]XP_024372060.1 Fanconi anemia group D2 protein-like isoform X1 [Physcomitrium patens]PNR57706.1 hypothetical protein PHYPA_004700 [Physcomitrium patens]|eukprot:XP_024372058.1 Fanconi anemia group D2 protein-like isoform X1 [Physcomitrella patens]
MSSSKKRPPPSVNGNGRQGTQPVLRRRVDQQKESDCFVKLLSEAGCRLSSDGPIQLSRELQQRLELRLARDSSLVGPFLAGFQSHIENGEDLHRVLMPMTRISNYAESRPGVSLARTLLCISPIQTAVANILLEKLPEHIGEDASSTSTLPALMDSIPRLILNQFKWLNFLVDSKSLTEKLLEVLTICPLALKKEIISFLPEVIVDADHEMVMQALEQMLQEDLQLVVPVLDAFSNMNLEPELFEQVVTVAVSSLRTADAEDLPLVIKFLLQSATSTNVKLIIEQLREHLQFVTISDVRSSKPDRKQKGLVSAPNCEALILEAIRSGLRLQNIACEAVLKEIRGLEGVQRHKVVDIWLLLIIHANGAPHRKAAESLLKRKVIQGEFTPLLIRLCVHGRGESLQDYFKTLLSVGDSFLRSPEVATHEFGTQVYTLLYEEFAGDFFRREVLGSLITHIGSGISTEIGAALHTLWLIAKRKPQELLPMSTFLNGILDYLEGFQDTHLHQVYSIFCHIAMAARERRGASGGTSVADDLLIIVRKQISNPDLKYKRMGVIGVTSLVTCLGSKASEEDALAREGMADEESNLKEAVTLLQMTMDACKTSPVARAYFYDELSNQLEASVLHPSIIEWVVVQTEEFSTVYLGDLEGGKLPAAQDVCEPVEGEVWMNLDGDMSPIILNILPMLTSSSDKSLAQSLLYLFANIRLLAVAERATNSGSLGGIDALLGCPLYLPKHELLLGEQWVGLSRNCKEICCLSLFYAINWIRELINAFSTQIQARLDDCDLQLTLEETTTKLFKRLRNLLCLEQRLNECLKAVPNLSFPQLHFLTDDFVGDKYEKKESNPSKDTQKAGQKRMPKLSKKEKGNVKGAKDPNAGDGNTQDSQRSQQGQPAGTLTTAAEAPQKSGTTIDAAKETVPWNGSLLDEQRWKCRALTLTCTAILSMPEGTVTACCADSACQLPLYLYLLRDLYNKLDISLEQPTRKLAPWIVAAPIPKVPSGLGSLVATDVLKRLQTVFPSLKRHLNSAISQLRQEEEHAAFEEHWMVQSTAAGNPVGLVPCVSSKETAQSFLMITLRCLGKVLAYPDLTLPTNYPVFKELISAFSSVEGANELAAGLLPRPPTGSLEHVFCGTYSFLDGLHAAAAASSLAVATQLVMVLKALVDCAKACENQPSDERRRRSSFVKIAGFLPLLRAQLSVSAGRVLTHDWDAFEPWKSKGDMLQQLLHLHIRCNSSPIDLLEEMACNVLPQVPTKGSKINQGVEGYPALSYSTFLIWYRVQHEEVLGLFEEVMKEVLSQIKSKNPLVKDAVVELLTSAHHCIKVHVALVNLTKSHEKSAVHAVAVKCGGKFVDTFLKGMDFFQAKFEAHKDIIVSSVKELQKATRIVQTICAEAKGHKRMPVATKVPAVKRSMEKFIFCVKALLHGASNGSAFWMGNLKHKDLQGREVASQLYPEANGDEDEEDEEQEEEEHDSDETVDENVALDAEEL